MQFITFLLGIITGLLIAKAFRKKQSGKNLEENFYYEIFNKENENK